MAGRHFEIIASGRQLAVLLGIVVTLMVVAFALGVTAGLRLSDEGPTVAEVAAPPPLWPPAAEQVTAWGTAVPLATPLVLDTPAVAAEEGGVREGVPAAGLPTPPPVPPPTVAPTVPPTPPPRPTAPPVRPTVAAPRPTAMAGVWVQVAALSRQDLADGVRQRLMAVGYTREQVTVQPLGSLFRVRLGPFPDTTSAERVAARLQELGFERPFVVKE